MTAPATTDLAESDPAYEGQIAGDLVRRLLIVSPAVLLVAGVVRGVDGLISAAIGLVLVALNFLVAARLISYTARRSPGAVMGVVLGGYIVRIGLLFAIALALENVSWVDVPVLVLTIAIVHLALLTWETRHVSLTLGFPGLKPGRQ
ncbi:MAG: hypothetical protein QOF40_3366 [Actinomycetota bacterium]|nr:hypothetical protein [Actinomycetota bacterium]